MVMLLLAVLVLPAPACADLIVGGVTVTGVFAPYIKTPGAVDLLAHPGADIPPMHWAPDGHFTEIAFDVEVIGLQPGSLTFEASLAGFGDVTPTSWKPSEAGYTLDIQPGATMAGLTVGFTTTELCCTVLGVPGEFSFSINGSEVVTLAFSLVVPGVPEPGVDLWLVATLVAIALTVWRRSAHH
jgi:hypothetical protein